MTPVARQPGSESGQVLEDAIFLKESAVAAELRRSMGSLLNLLFGVLVGVAIVAAFWLLASFIDDLRHQTHNVR